jgi:uncharacterized protein (TIGR03084 family)
MDDEITALAAQQQELDDLLAGRSEADWRLPSRCEGWSVADVMTHLCQTDEMAVASVRGDYHDVLGRLLAGIDAPDSMDDAIDAMVSRDRDVPIDDLRRRWAAASSDQVAALSSCDPHARVPWVAGTLSARTLATTRLAETWIHTGDVAWAFGLEPEATDRLRLIVRLAWRTLPHAFSIHDLELSGPVAFELTGPNGDDWSFRGDEPARTTITGDAAELCAVASRRTPVEATSLHGTGPDAATVLSVVRTWA